MERKRVACRVCNKTFTSHSSRAEHERGPQHSASPQEECQFCEKRFWMKATLRCHKRKCHAADAPQLVCEVDNCG